MELYHIHILGNKDNLYKKGKELNINKDTFNNKLFEKVMDTKTSVSVEGYPESVRKLNNIMAVNGYNQYTNEVSLAYILDVITNSGRISEEGKKALIDAKKVIANMQYLKRELAIEDYRKDNCDDKPSRMHSLYACSEEGVEYWISILSRNCNANIFRIDACDEVFHTNENLLPSEESSYRESYALASRYFNPREKNFNLFQDEYLVQGRVRILEKVDESRTSRRHG